MRVSDKVWDKAVALAESLTPREARGVLLAGDSDKALLRREVRMIFKVPQALEILREKVREELVLEKRTDTI